MLNSIALPKDFTRPPETILVNTILQETRVAVLEENNICELHIERNRSHHLVGNIYLGRVQRVLPGMQSAFIDIGLERAAFLHIADTLEQRRQPDKAHRIEHVLFEGQSVLVQVIKEPINSKGARLSTCISLAGHFLVYLPQETHINISQRIETEKERNSLHARLTKLLSEKHTKQGYIVRTNAETATDAQLQTDIDYLSKVWKNIHQHTQTCAPETLLYQDLPLSLRVLRDMYSENICEILVDTAETCQHMQAFAKQYVPSAVAKIKQFNGSHPLFEQHNIDQVINHALQPRVNLNFGGYLIIETTEAMTTIDVNTGSFTGIHHFEDTVFRINLEACHTIARELRLRNIGGIIIIDFVDMAHTNHKEAVLAELAKVLSLDRTRITLNGFTALGLVELTRKRTRESLNHILCEPCTACRGQGSLKSAQSICYDIQREIIRQARCHRSEGFRILAAPKVIDLFLDEKQQLLATVIDFIGKPVFLTAETAYTQEQYDIVPI